MPQAVHAVVGTGDSSTKAINEALRDIVAEGDAVNIVWEGRPPASVEAVYDFVTDNEVEFTLFYSDDSKPPSIFRDADHGVVQKSRDPVSKAVAGVAGKGKVLVLWDDDEAEELVNRIFQVTGPKTLVLDLSNGLVPIVLEEGDEPYDQAAIDEEEAHEEAKATGKYDDEDDPAERDHADEDDPEEDETKFTREELENMQAAAVKRYGARLNLHSATKKGIIEELFPEDEEEVEEDAPEPEEAPSTFRTPANDPVQQTIVDKHQLERSLTNHKPSDSGVESIEALRKLAKKLGEAILDSQPPSRHRSLAITALEESVMWGVKGIVLTEEDDS